MKKIVKGTTFFAVMFLLLISLTACGEDKLTLTRVDDNVKMTVELKFKNDKVVESKTTYQYDLLVKVAKAPTITEEDKKTSTEDDNKTETKEESTNKESNE